MARRGKSINLYLMDGDPNGRAKCTLANWTGVAYKIPRIDIDKCKDREDLKQSGVYFLFGTSDTTGKNVVYIGQAGARKNGEGILNRLQEHRLNPNKDYWTEAVAFTTSNNTFGPTEISYLENRFCNMALQAQRYEVKNANEPTMGNITEEKECEMEEFIDNVKLIMGALGHKVFESLDQPVPAEACPSSEPTEKGALLHLERMIKDVGTVIADGKQTSDGFVVYKGSHISPTADHTVSATIKEKRNAARVDENGVLLENVFFTSPSSAAVYNGSVKSDTF